jgi:hypothetical protein
MLGLARNLLQFVIADVRFATDPQHTQKERGEDDLYAKKKPHRPKKDFANLIKRTEAAGRPLPRDPSTSKETGEENQTPND